MLHEHFLNAMGGLVVARQELESYSILARYQPITRLGDRWVFLPNAALMTEATFRLMKYIQHGGPSSLTDAAKLWQQAATPEPLGFPEARSVANGRIPNTQSVPLPRPQTTGPRQTLRQSR